MQDSEGYNQLLRSATSLCSTRRGDPLSSLQHLRCCNQERSLQCEGRRKENSICIAKECNPVRYGAVQYGVVRSRVLPFLHPPPPVANTPRQSPGRLESSQAWSDEARPICPPQAFYVFVDVSWLGFGILLEG